VKPILEIENISKRFQIHHQGLPYLSFRDKLTGLFKRSETKEEFWALKDISFSVAPGESLGIIGRNGAGKSTLLKILSRITPPTRGRIICRGRIASLLEVGTGFHQELSGRENIYMNGSILGMKKREIDSKFDEIVDFSGTEKFLDTPLKHYSSGMQLRLAFAVAAHLEPEVLIIDEVLAVGDAEFQKKCLRKMNDVVKKGNTILFVSHNLSALQNLCKTALLLSGGKIHSAGPVSTIIDNYTSLHGKPVNDYIDLSSLKRNYKGVLQFSSIRFKKATIRFGEPINFTVEISSAANTSFDEINLATAINDKNGVTIIHATNEISNTSIDFRGSSNAYEFNIENNLRPGMYSITLFMRAKGIIQDWLTDEISLTIEDGNPYGYTNTEAIQGQIFPAFSIIKK
jgi:lipopolysaccharide transport system ATP-binding protein